jgi:hypothetical protein
MMRSLLALTLLSIAGSARAQAANDSIKGLEACFEAARLADAVCGSPANNSVQRLDCFQKARTAQLECLQHVPLGMSAEPETPENPKEGATQPHEVAPKVPAASLETSTGATAPAQEASRPTGSNLPPLETVPEVPTGTIASHPAVSPEPSQSLPPAEKAKADVSLDQPNAPPAPSTIDPVGNTATRNWVVSETTSPIDYSALITATIRSVASAKDAPVILTFRCRQSQTEVSLRTEGTFSPLRGAEVQVTYQINDQSVVKSNWAVSADRKTLAYKDDPAELLRSLPQGAKLKINVLDQPGASHQAAFQLNGLDIIRNKIAAACKWTPAQLSAGKR